MRGLGDHLTVGERVAVYRKRRGLSQRALAELVGKVENWIYKAEHNKIRLDRLSVIREIAAALDVSIADLLGEPVLLAWSAESGRHTVPALREALTDWRNHLPIPGAEQRDVELGWIQTGLDAAWRDYQSSQYGRLAATLPGLVTASGEAARVLTGDQGRAALASAASAHQLSTVYLTKLGETDLALLSASHGLDFAKRSEDPAVVGALYRSQIHALSAIGQYEQAAGLADAAAANLATELSGADATPLGISMLGMLHLVGGLSAAREDHRAEAERFLEQAANLAERLPATANEGYSAFNQVNVEIHRVSIAVELDNLPRAVVTGPQLDTSGMPVERRARHAIEVARAQALFGQRADAVRTLLEAEQFAPEQIRYHRIPRELIRRAIRGRDVNQHVLDLAARMGVAEL